MHGRSEGIRRFYSGGRRLDGSKSGNPINPVGLRTFVAPTLHFSSSPSLKRFCKSLTHSSMTWLNSYRDITIRRNGRRES